MTDPVFAHETAGDERTEAACTARDEHRAFLPQLPPARAGVPLATADQAGDEYPSVTKGHLWLVRGDDRSQLVLGRGLPAGRRSDVDEHDPGAGWG